MGDKDHVPHGDRKAASRVRTLAVDAGLEISSYGSYYWVGVSEGEGLPFRSVLDRAVALGAPTIRVWAGTQDYGESEPEFIEGVITDTNRIADLRWQVYLCLVFLLLLLHNNQGHHNLGHRR